MCAGKNDIALETVQLLLFWDMLSILFDIFSSKAEIYENNHGIIIVASFTIYHDVFGLKIIESPFGAVSILKDADQLYSNCQNPLELIDSFQNIQILLQIHRVEGHDIESYQLIVTFLLEILQIKKPIRLHPRSGIIIDFLAEFALGILIKNRGHFFHGCDLGWCHFLVVLNF